MVLSTLGFFIWVNSSHALGQELCLILTHFLSLWSVK